jgi:hypothetical protein
MHVHKLMLAASGAMQITASAIPPASLWIDPCLPLYVWLGSKCF